MIEDKLEKIADVRYIFNNPIKQLFKSENKGISGYIRESDHYENKNCVRKSNTSLKCLPLENSPKFFASKTNESKQFLDSKILNADIKKNLNKINTKKQGFCHEYFESGIKGKIKSSKSVNIKKLILNLSYELNLMKSHIEERLSQKNSFQNGFFNNDLLASLKSFIKEEIESERNLIRDDINGFYQSKSNEICELSKQIMSEIKGFNSNSRQIVTCETSTKPQLFNIMKVQLNSLEKEFGQIQQKITGMKKNIRILTQENENTQQKLSKLDSQVYKQQADLNLKAKESIEINFQISKINKEILTLSNENSREAIFLDKIFKSQLDSQDALKNTLNDMNFFHNQEIMHKCDDLINKLKSIIADLLIKLKKNLKKKSKKIESKLFAMVNKSKIFFKESQKLSQETYESESLSVDISECFGNSKELGVKFSMEKWKMIVQDTIIKYPDWHQENLKRILDYNGGIGSPDNLLWRAYNTGDEGSKFLNQIPGIFAESQKILWEWKKKQLDEDESAIAVILNYILEWKIIDPKTMHYINTDCKKRDVQVLPGGKAFPYKITKIKYLGDDLLWWVNLLVNMLMNGISLREEITISDDKNDKGTCFIISHNSKRVKNKIGVIKDSFKNEGLEGVIKRAKETISLRCENKRIQIDEKGRESLAKEDKLALLRRNTIIEKNNSYELKIIEKELEHAEKSNFFDKHISSFIILGRDNPKERKNTKFTKKRSNLEFMVKKK